MNGFEFSCFNNIGCALIDGLSQNQAFFSVLLGISDVKRQVLGIFTDETCSNPRKS